MRPDLSHTCYVYQNLPSLVANGQRPSILHRTYFRLFWSILLRIIVVPANASTSNHEFYPHPPRDASSPVQSCGTLTKDTSTGVTPERASLRGQVFVHFNSGLVLLIAPVLVRSLFWSLQLLSRFSPVLPLPITPVFWNYSWPQVLQYRLDSSTTEA